MSIKKGQILEGIIKEVRFPNKGIVEIEDRQLVVKNGIPGQKIQFSVTKARPGKGEGRLNHSRMLGSLQTQI